MKQPWKLELFIILLFSYNSLWFLDITHSPLSTKHSLYSLLQGIGVTDDADGLKLGLEYIVLHTKVCAPQTFQ